MSNTIIVSLMDELTSSVNVTSVPTTMTVPYATITSVIGSASLHQASALSVIATATDSVTSISIINQLIQYQATLNYYSVLESIATATATPTAALAEAAQASAIMKNIFDQNAFYSGNTPSFGGNLALLIVYSIMLAFQVLFGVFYHQWWFLSCWTAGLVLEILGYAGRVWSSQNIMNLNAYIMQLVCLTLAPCFLMAGIYYIIAQLTLVYGQKFSVLKPMMYSLIFIGCDVISIALQAAGGGMAAGALAEFQDTRQGANVMVGGLAFQVFSIGVFFLFWVLFLYRIRISFKANGDAEFSPDFVHIRERKPHFLYLWTVTISVVLVFVRSVYRLIELSEGWSSDLAVDEIYFMILEALMIALASFLMTAVHPGIAYGRHSHLYIDKTALFKTRKHKNGTTDEENDIDNDDDDDMDAPVEADPDAYVDADPYEEYSVEEKPEVERNSPSKGFFAHFKRSNAN